MYIQDCSLPFPAMPKYSSDEIAEKAGYHPDAQDEARFILEHYLSFKHDNKNANIDKFEAFCEEHVTEHRLKHGTRDGETAMHVAASCFVANASLLKYLAIMSPKLLNLANHYGMTPLFHVILWPEKDAAKVCSVAKELINLGAKVNYMTTLRHSKPYRPLDEDYTMIEAEETVVSLAAEKTNNLKLIQLLILNGGVIYNCLSDQGQAKVNAAIQELFEKVKPLLQAWKLDTLPYSLSKEVISLIVNPYLHLLNG